MARKKVSVGSGKKEENMALATFGAILNFAEQIEKDGEDFFGALAANPDCAARAFLYAQYAKEAGKNRKTVRRTRRENVTEMILEAIEGFPRQPYEPPAVDPAGLGGAEAGEIARVLEERAEAFYLVAAEKLGALSEVSRALKALAQKHGARLRKLAP